MPKKVPSEFTGRFSVKPKKSSSKPENAGSISPSSKLATLPDSLRDEPISLRERRRKLIGNGVEEGHKGTSVQDRDDVEELNTYSQQLEVQPPSKKRMLQVAEQTELQDQHGAIFSNPGQSEYSAHEPERKREPETLPGPQESYQYQEEAFAILKNGWQGNDHSRTGIEATAQALANRAASVPDAETLLFPRQIVRAMLVHASNQPQTLDFMLLTFSEAIQMLPRTLTDKHGSGSDTTITQLKWLLIGEFRGFDGFLLPDSSATIDVEDRSNLKFQQAQIKANLGGVLSQIRDWRFQRQIWLVASATKARCFALEILRRKLGEQIESAVDDGLNRKHERWSKVDMLGACILLRGCARSLKANVPTSKVKIFSWKTSLENFLLQDDESRDNDFVIKAHAAVRKAPLHTGILADLANTDKLALSNLIDGPFDETSEQLFAAGSWVF